MEALAKNAFREPALAKEVEDWLITRATSGEKESFERVMSMVLPSGNRLVAALAPAPEPSSGRDEPPGLAQAACPASTSAAAWMPQSWGYTCTAAALVHKPKSRPRSAAPVEGVALATMSGAGPVVGRVLSGQPGGPGPGTQPKAVRRPSSAPPARCSADKTSSLGALIAKGQRPPSALQGAERTVPPAPPTSSMAAYGLMLTHPDLYHDLEAAGRAQRGTNLNFTSEWGDSLKKGSGTAWQQYLQSTYEQFNGQVISKNDAFARRKQRALAQWVSSQRLYYGELLSPAAVQAVDAALAAAGPAQRRAALDILRTLHAVARPCAGQSTSSQAHGQVRPFEDPEYRTMATKLTQIKTYGWPNTAGMAQQMAAQPAAAQCATGSRTSGPAEGSNCGMAGLAGQPALVPAAALLATIAPQAHSGKSSSGVTTLLDSHIAALADPSNTAAEHPKAELPAPLPQQGQSDVGGPQPLKTSLMACIEAKSGPNWSKSASAHRPQSAMARLSGASKPRKSSTEPREPAGPGKHAMLSADEAGRRPARPASAAPHAGGLGPGLSAEQRPAIGHGNAREELKEMRRWAAAGGCAGGPGGGPRMECLNDTHRSNVPMRWAAASLAPAGTSYQAAYGSVGSLRAGGGTTVQVGRCMAKDVGMTHGHVDPVVHPEVGRTAILAAVPAVFLETPVEQGQRGRNRIAETTSRFTYQPREEADVLRSVRAARLAIESSRTARRHSTVPLGRSGVQAGAPAGWSSSYAADFAPQKADTEDSRTRAQRIRAVFTGPSISVGAVLG